MKKILWIVLDAVLLIVFNVLFFLMGGTEHPASVWISYGFIHFAYLMLLLTPLFVREGSGAEQYRRPLFGISGFYFFAEFIMGIIFILIAPEGFKLALSLQLVLMGIYVIMLVSNMLANEHTADSIERTEHELKYVKESSALLDSIMRQVADNRLKRKVEKVYDLIHSSPSRSSYAVFHLEQDVINEIGNLYNAVIKKDTQLIIQISDKIYSLAEERNRQLRISNK